MTHPDRERLLKLCKPIMDREAERVLSGIGNGNDIYADANTIATALKSILEAPDGLTEEEREARAEQITLGALRKELEELRAFVSAFHRIEGGYRADTSGYKRDEDALANLYLNSNRLVREFVTNE